MGKNLNFHPNRERETYLSMDEGHDAFPLKPELWQGDKFIDVATGLVTSRIIRDETKEVSDWA